MKKAFIIVLIIVLILIIPFPARMKDGGTMHYNAILYDIYDVHRISTPSEAPPEGEVYEREYIEGRIVKIFGVEVFNNTDIEI